MSQKVSLSASFIFLQPEKDGFSFSIPSNASPSLEQIFQTKIFGMPDICPIHRGLPKAQCHDICFPAPPSCKSNFFCKYVWFEIIRKYFSVEQIYKFPPGWDFYQPLFLCPRCPEESNCKITHLCFCIFLHDAKCFPPCKIFSFSFHSSSSPWRLVSSYCRDELSCLLVY